jgi:opacity protein-like surface antigen
MQRQLFVLFLGILILAPGTAGAQTAEDQLKGLYFELRGGGVLLDDADNSGPGFTGDFVVESEFDPGLVVDGAVGYAHRSGLRGEVAFGYRTNDLDRLALVEDGGLGAFLGLGSLNGLSSSDVDGEAQMISVMANGFYDFDLGNGIRPFLGAGIGAGFYDLEAELLGVELVDDRDTVFAYQGLAGVSYAMTRDVSVGVLYSYFATGDPSLSDAAGGSFDSEYSSHSLMLSIRFTR